MDVRIFRLIPIERYYREPFASYERQVALIDILMMLRKSFQNIGPFSILVFIIVAYLYILWCLFYVFNMFVIFLSGLRSHQERVV